MNGKGKEKKNFSIFLRKICIASSTPMIDSSAVTYPFDADIDVTNFTVILGKVYSVGPRDPVSWSHRGLNLIPNRVYNYTWQAIFMCWARFLSIVSHGLNSTTRLAYRLNSPRKHSAFLAALYLEALWNVSPNEFAYSFAVLNRPIKKEKRKRKEKEKNSFFFFTSNMDVEVKKKKEKRKTGFFYTAWNYVLTYKVCSIDE